jgi:hypothetical protein
VDYTQNTMLAAIKAMDAVIIPAVDSTGDSQAREQARLVTDFLKFAAQRISLIGDREAYQLRTAINLARQLAEDGQGLPSSSQLDSARQQAEAALADPGCSGAARRRATADLEAALRRIVLDSTDAPDDQRTRIGRAVIAAAKVQIAADRSWLLPLGFDPAPATLEPVETALGVAPTPAN